jgi:hypothetical protein
MPNATHGAHCHIGVIKGIVSNQGMERNAMSKGVEWPTLALLAGCYAAWLLVAALYGAIGPVRS